MKYCPSCHSDLVSCLNDYGKYQVYCTCCNMSGPIEHSKQDAIKKWDNLPRNKWNTAPPTVTGKYLVLIGDDVSMIEVRNGLKRSLGNDNQFVEYQEVEGLPLTATEYFDLFKVKAWTDVVLPSNGLKTEENKNVI